MIQGPGGGWFDRKSEWPVLLLAAESSEDEAVVLAQALAQQIAVASEGTNCSDLLAFVAEVVTLDLYVLPAQRVAGDGRGDLEQE